MKFDEFQVRVGDCILVCKKIVVMMYVNDYLIDIRVRELILRLRCKLLSEDGNPDAKAQIFGVSAQIHVRERKTLCEGANL